MKTAQSVQAVVVKPMEEGLYDFRKLQVHEQQSERQRKNMLQKTMIFAARADALQREDPGIPKVFIHNVHRI